MVFRNLWILTLLPLLLFAFFATRRMQDLPGFLFPSSDTLKGIRPTLKLWLVRKIDYFRIFAIILILLALARPQLTTEKETKKEGIGIVIAIDTSSTMLADDIKLGFEDLVKMTDRSGKKKLRRIDAVREVAADFIKSRPDDIIGIVAFAGEAFVVCPMTFDHAWLLQTLNRVEVGLIEDGTAIGSGILSSLNSLRDIDAKTRVLILLTDGINNYGRTPPLIAAKAARSLGVKIYTLGLIGQGEGLALASDGSGRKVYKGSKIDVDEKEMEKISELTNGKYFSITDMNSLRESYEEINALEKTMIEERGTGTYVDLFPYFLFPALGLLLLDTLLRNTLLKRIP